MKAELHRCPTCASELTDELRPALGLKGSDWLKPLLPGSIAPSDIDEVVGIDGTDRVVFLEYKRSGAGPSVGQSRLLKQLSRRPNQAVLYIQGTEDPVKALWLMNGVGDVGWFETSKAALAADVTDWLLARKGAI